MDEREVTEAQADRPDDAGAATKTTAIDNAGTTSQAEQAASPQLVLDELTRKQQEAEANAKRYTEQSQALRTDITALQRAQGETGDTATAYGKAKPSLDQQRDDLKDYIDKKRDNIVAAVGAKRQQVDDAATAVENEATRLESGRQTQWTELVQLAKDRLGDERYLTAATERFDAAKARQTTIKARLTRLTELQQELDAAEEAGLGVKMYAVLGDFDRLLGLSGSELQPVDDYRKDLEAAWASLNSAQGALRETTQKEAEKQRQLQATKDELARLEVKRVDEILKRVPEGTATGTGAAAESTTGAAAATPPRPTA